MNLNAFPTQVLIDGYSCYWISDNGLWMIGTWPVLYGVRAIAWHRDSVSRSADYCAGSDAAFLAELLAVLRTIFSALPESTTEDEMTKLLPNWRQRPIDTDPCWPALQQLAATLAATPEATND